VNEFITAIVRIISHQVWLFVVGTHVVVGMYLLGSFSCISMRWWGKLSFELV